CSSDLYWLSRNVWMRSSKNWRIMPGVYGSWVSTNKDNIMKVRPSQRISDIREYYFSSKLREIAELKAQGRPIINLGIGSPDRPPHASVREVLVREASREEGHGYQSYYGIPELRQAFSDWYHTQ